MAKKTLIYIIGAGRSGTTLLDIILGNNENSISLGEVNRFFKRDGKPPKRKENSNVFLFWNTINTAFKEIDNDISYSYYDKLFKKNEYHSKILKSNLKQNSLEYINALQLQYNLLNSHIQESILIESSKYPIRGLNLSMYLSKDTFDIKYIYLKKDPVKVVKSFQKKDIEQPAKGFLSANLYYLLVNLLCVFVVKKLKKRGHDVATITYEELIENDEKTLARIANELGLDFQTLLKKISNKEVLHTGFLFDGNRIRLKETLTLRTSDSKTRKTVTYYFTRIFNYIVYRK
jgi:hypothetical protein